MSNMSYCRFENTAKDLKDCEDNFDDLVSEREGQARLRIYDICRRIIDSFEREDLEELIEKD